jgi:uncharacterized membrane protein YeiH
MLQLLEFLAVISAASFGVLLARSKQMDVIGVCCVAFIVAFGGVIGDIVCNDLPRLFRPTVPLYASCSFVGCWVYLLLRLTDGGETVALRSGAATIVIVRLVALALDLKLPATGA